ncbi:MAG TPA: dienelactone hydrolase family protein [Gemmatimonadales bacterium]|nr:dienelactone hydrolase family protein [Gemmatimonadales bacterium]
MREHFLGTTRTARYFTLGAPARAQDLWFCCHGYGQLAARFLERFRVIEGEHRAFVAPEGLSRFYLSENPAERRVGASWMTREDRLHEIDDYVRYLDAVYAAVQPRAAAITALGFSQGTATVTRWAALGSARIDRLILWGGEVPPDLDLERLRVARLLLVYGTRDEFFTPKVVAANETRLRDHGIAYELLSFDGGHALDAETLKRLV